MLQQTTIELNLQVVLLRLFQADDFEDLVNLLSEDNGEISESDCVGITGCS